MKKSEVKATVERYYTDVYKYAFAKTRNKEAALDITQETFLIFLKKSPKLDNSKILPWLICVCANKVKEYFRAQKREKNFISIDEIENIPANDKSSDSFDSISLFNDIQKKILALLTPEEQKLFIELFIKKTDIKIFAKENGISENTANVRKSRLKKKAKQLYKNTYFFFMILCFKIFYVGM